jgi:hypothetical protein
VGTCPEGVGGPWSCSDYSDVLHFWVLNTGDETISDLSHIDVMLLWDTKHPYLYENGSGTEGTMTYCRVGIYKSISSNNVSNPAPEEDINIGKWDPGEYLMGRIEIGTEPYDVSALDYVSVVLPNGGETTSGGDIDWEDVTC